MPELTDAQKVQEAIKYAKQIQGHLAEEDPVDAMADCAALLVILEGNGSSSTPSGEKEVKE